MAAVARWIAGRGWAVRNAHACRASVSRALVGCADVALYWILLWGRRHRARDQCHAQTTNETLTLSSGGPLGMRVSLTMPLVDVCRCHFLRRLVRFGNLNSGRSENFARSTIYSLYMKFYVE